MKACVDEKRIGSKGCPTLAYDDVLAEADREYDRPQIREFARQASRQEADCSADRHQRPYVMQPTKTRIAEICEFAEKMRYRRLGLAFCLGLAKEAVIVEEIFKDRGFEVVSVLCKAGKTSKDRIGITDEDKIYRGTDQAMCNPIYQAKLLNHEKTELNILLDLCARRFNSFLRLVLACMNWIAALHCPAVPSNASSSQY